MITVEEAKAAIVQYTPIIGTKIISVPKALNHVLAGPILSPIDMPPFPQSAMDGYALGSGPRGEGATFKVIGEVAAGSAIQFDLGHLECVRIFTGAPVPKSCSAVVQQEWVSVVGDSIKIDQEVHERMHIRPQGEQMKKGDKALEKGTDINAATIGFLAMLGLTEVEVFEKPKVNVLVTGNELIEPGKELGHGEIYESNATMLLAALKMEGIEAKSTVVPDDYDSTKTAISGAILKSDVLILSGGISVGDHDHVGKALIDLGVEQLFYKVKQKPGKPLFFGRMGKKLVFALPGNPAASLSCYYQYVRNAIRRMQHHPNPEHTVIQLPLAQDFLNKGGRSQFLKAKIKDSKVEILGGQSSAMLNTFALADALAYVPSEASNLKAGDMVEVHLLGT